tara:strand:+ start:615 stop:1487 length:873 start_codon:yes stop_codon:yes gene_type:complete
MKRPIFKNQEHNSQYLEKGYIRSSLLSSEQVDDLLENILKLNPDDNFSPDRNGASNYHCSFLDTNEEYKRESNKLFKTIFRPILDTLFHNYEIWNANLYVKQPGKGKFEIHQNWTHVEKEEQTTFTIWCPLVDTSIENGTLALVEGSHKIMADLATLNVPYYFKNFESELLEKYLKPMPCSAGDAIIFEDGVIHYSDVNKSDKPRYALQILIGPKEVKPVYYFFDKGKNEFEVFEINEDFFLKNNYKTFHKRPTKHMLKRRIKNENLLIEEDEFVDALKNGQRRRENLYY